MGKIGHTVTYILKLVEDHPMIFKGLIFVLLGVMLLLAAIDELWLDQTA